MRVEVVYALPERQTLRAIEIEGEATALGAVRQSGILSEHPELVAESLSLGVFGEPVAHDHRLRDGDRVEIYRPLRIDPREARRRLARRGEVMGRPSSPDETPPDD